MKKILKRLLTVTMTLATLITALLATQVQASINANIDMYKSDHFKMYIPILTFINQYLTKELQDSNVDTIRIDIPTSSAVNDVLIWSVEQSGTDEFIATYEVDQQIKENDHTKAVKAMYLVRVHVDADNKLVIVQNPTLAKTPDKSTYEPKAPEANGSVNADTITDAIAFLETFFKLYPTKKRACLLCAGECP